MVSALVHHNSGIAVTLLPASSSNSRSIMACPCLHSQALRHPYFLERPLPRLPEYMPTFPSAHDAAEAERQKEANAVAGRFHAQRRAAGAPCARARGMREAGTHCCYCWRW